MNVSLNDLTFPEPQQPRSPVTLFTVPEDKWLIVTDIDITTMISGVMRWELFEDVGGELVRKRSAPVGLREVLLPRCVGEKRRDPSETQ